MPVTCRLCDGSAVVVPVPVDEKFSVMVPVSIPATLPTIMLIFSTRVLYPAYAGGPDYLGWGFKADQEIAGAIMGAGVTVLIWILVAYNFFAWWAEEQRDEGSALPALPDNLTWADVEQRMASTPAPPRS